MYSTILGTFSKVLKIFLRIHLVKITGNPAINFEEGHDFEFLEASCCLPCPREVGSKEESSSGPLPSPSPKFPSETGGGT